MLVHSYNRGMDAPTYVSRLLDGRLADLLAQLPALMVVGPRATGKTTSARRHARSVVRLDRPAEAAAFRADPDAALAAFGEPVLLDEWQEVPEVLGAVKRAVDADFRPGRFLLTGSVWSELTTTTWPGTGRVVRLPMYGLTVREIEGRGERGEGDAPAAFVDRLASPDAAAMPLPAVPPDLVGYVELALRGGFPESALRLQGSGREAWLEGYVDQVVTRDALGLEPRRDPVRLRRYFEAVALNSAGVVADETLVRASGVDRKTALAYHRLLTNLLVLDSLPAWSSNRLSRLNKRPKRLLVDASLLGAVRGATPASVLADGALLGRLLETFVVAQIRAEIPVSMLRPRLFHFRQDDGRREVDMIAELGAGRIVAMEVKVTSSPTLADARHLTWLRDQYQDRFVAGAVLHTGPNLFRLADRVYAIPVCALWG